MPPGIEVRHSLACPAREGRRCRCAPTYRAFVYSARDRRKLRESFPTLAAARAWRSDAQGAVRRGALRAGAGLTLRQAAAAWLEGAEEGTIRTRSGERYRPSTLRGYREALRGRILPDLGGARLSDIAPPDLQALVDRLTAAGLDPSTIRNALMPLRAIYRRAIASGEVAVNPTTGLTLPAVRGVRERIASPSEASQLLAALPEADRALWATAFYGGLRRGELAALRFEDIDLGAGLLRVERSYEFKTRAYGPPKSRAGRRRVPIPAVLRDFLDEHKLKSAWEAGLCFGRTPELPFDPSSLRARALSAWRRAGLEPIGLHEARHTFASLMIAAGVGPKPLSTYMGHAGIAITYDRYGHLLPGSEDQAARLLDAYLARSNTAAPLSSLDGNAAV